MMPDTHPRPLLALDDLAPGRRADNELTRAYVNELWAVIREFVAVDTRDIEIARLREALTKRRAGADTIYAATEWVTNAQMIQDVHRLGYLKDTDHVLDPTYGRGTWWRLWRPSLTGLLIGHTWHEPLTDEGPEPSWDFRSMWYDDEEFDAVAFDPPYVCVGGRETTTLHTMHDAYGMGDAPTTPQGVQDDINGGLTECYRVVKKGGIVLVKVQSYVSSGKLWPGTFLTYNAAIDIGFKLEDHLCHISGARPQPPGRPQQHARRNQSDLLVLRRPRR